MDTFKRSDEEIESNGCEKHVYNDESTVESHTENEDYIERFHTEVPEAKRNMNGFYKLFKYCDKFEWLFLIILIGLAVLEVYLIDKTEIFSSYGGAVIVFFCIFFLIAGVKFLKFVKNYIVPYMYSARCAKWLTENNIDATQFIKERYELYMSKCDFSGISDDLFAFAQGVLMAASYKDRSRIKNHIVVNSVVMGLLSAWLAFVVPFIIPTAAMAIRSGDITLILVAAVPVVAFIILRILLFYILTIPDMKRVSSQYANK